ncbi:Hypothetical_protein [Hexamita inflata]|uniref:Hypothetical_protein n=1 Tax=Hexamita inflata TaxID=28002 RepID=A0AA86P7H2_9EUKA|nr:Hypothetical protein HINF_LOCUS19435 [Hexamita inflata]
MHTQRKVLTVDQIVRQAEKLNVSRSEQPRNSPLVSPEQRHSLCTDNVVENDFQLGNIESLPSINTKMSSRQCVNNSKNLSSEKQVAELPSLWSKVTQQPTIDESTSEEQQPDVVQKPIQETNMSLQEKPKKKKKKRHVNISDSMVEKPLKRLDTLDPDDIF